MYVVKLRYKHNIDACYANESVIHSANDIRNADKSLKLSWFFLPLEKARKLVIELVGRNGQAQGWYQPPQELEFISIVELSNYAPYREYQVLEYREFK